jgi:outer membrane receptor for ferrienterochelin and colicins
MTKNYLFVLLIVLPITVFSQTGVIQGRISGEDGRPLIGANVILRHTLLGSASDLHGKFLIRKIQPGTYQLRVSMIGYNPVEMTLIVKAGETTEKDIKLSETALKTDEIIVTAGKRQQSLEDVPVSVAVFDAEEINKRTLHRLDDALRYIPGVNMTESQINIRGSSGYSRALGSRVLVLIDGIPMLNADAGEVKFDVIPMYSIERIEVVKGSGSALYGSSALGGVINVITKEPRSPIYNARVYSGFYDDPYHDEWKWWGDSPRYFNGVDLLHGNAIDEISYMVSGGIRNNQAFRRNDESFRFNAGAKATYKFDPESKLSFSLNYASDEHGNWIYWKDIDNALVPPDESDLTETVSSTKLQFASQYHQTLSSSFAYSIKASVFRTNVDITSDTSDFSFRPNDRVQSVASAYTFEAQGIYAIGTANILTFGIDAAYNDVDALAYGVRHGYNAALYAQSDWEIYENLNLSSGLRFDYHKLEEKEGDSQGEAKWDVFDLALVGKNYAISPKIGLSYQPIKGTNVRASFGLGFRAPSIAERFTSAASGPIRTKPNPDLEPERSESYEIGIKQVLPIPVILDVAIFDNYYDNLVEPVFDNQDGKILFENITRARIYGAEVSLMASVIPNMLDVTVGYTYMNPRDLSADSSFAGFGAPLLKYRPEHLLYISGSFQYQNFTLGADFRYVAEIENIDVALGLLVDDAEERVPTYVTDFRLSYDFESFGLPLSSTFAVGNIFQYNYSEIVGNLAPIRNYMLTLDMRI